jgi:hypothetical protein
VEFHLEIHQIPVNFRQKSFVLAFLRRILLYSTTPFGLKAMACAPLALTEILFLEVGNRLICEEIGRLNPAVRRLWKAFSRNRFQNG